MPKVNGRVHSQWRSGKLSSAIVDAIPPEWLCAAYPGLRDLDLAKAVEKVAKETGGTVARARLVHNAMWEVIREEVHAVTVVARKKTALVCTLAGTAAKGKAMLEVVLAGVEPDTYRFTAARKVTVR